MNITNKLLGNPIIISLILIGTVLIMTFFIILQLDKDYKWMYFGCIILAYTLLIPMFMVMYECNRSGGKLFGGSNIDTNFGSIFDISGSSNVF